jgi:hypothetical protein
MPEARSQQRGGLPIAARYGLFGPDLHELTGTWL